MNEIIAAREYSKITNIPKFAGQYRDFGVYTISDPIILTNNYSSSAREVPMRPLRCVYLLLVVCVICLVSAWGQKEVWLPVTQQDLNIKEVPAIQLYYTQYVNDNDGTTFYYRRIKILTEKARQPGPDGYADVEIPLPSGFSLSGLKARTIHPDEAGKKKNLEDEAGGWLPNGSVVTMTGAQDWDATDDPLMVHLTIQVPSFASVAGKRLLMSSCLFQSKQKDAFKNAERKYPVYFPYAFAELDNVSIQIPSGYSFESTPARQDANLPYAKYQVFSKVEGSQLVTQRALLLNGVYFDLAKYKELKDFFGKVQVGDEQQVVLRAGGNVNDKKGE
jgi:hypothetical protein